MELGAKILEEREKDYFASHLNQVNISYEQIITRDGAKIEIIIYRPKTMTSESSAAYVYAHNGGGFACNARLSNGLMAVTTINLNCVVFSVDYRKGPEVKCPTG